MGQTFSRQNQTEEQRPSSLKATEDALVGQVGILQKIAQNHLGTTLSNLQEQGIVSGNGGMASAVHEVILFHGQDGDEFKKDTTKDSLIAAKFFVESGAYLEAESDSKKREALQKLAAAVQECGEFCNGNFDFFNLGAEEQESFEKIMQRVKEFEVVESVGTSDLRGLISSSGNVVTDELKVLAAVTENKAREEFLKRARKQLGQQEFNSLVEQIAKLGSMGGTEKGKKELEDFFQELGERLNEDSKSYSEEEVKSNRSGSLHTIRLSEGVVEQSREQERQQPKKFFERLATACQPREGGKPLVSHQGKNQSVL